MKTSRRLKLKNIVTTCLLILLFTLSVSDGDIDMLEYMYVSIIAMTYQVSLFKSETRIELQTKRIEKQSGLIFYFMTSGGCYGLMNEIDALPKIASATGQIYVDYEDVMQILKGDEIIER